MMMHLKAVFARKKLTEDELVVVGLTDVVGGPVGGSVTGTQFEPFS